MITSSALCLVFYILILTQVECSNLYVDPNIAYITGGKVSVSCFKTVEGRTTYADGIDWIEMRSASVISGHREARVRRDGHRLLFDSINHADEGLYCCKPSTEALTESHGCHYNSTVRIVNARTARASAKSSQFNSNVMTNTGHRIVAKSTTLGKLCMHNYICSLQLFYTHVWLDGWRIYLSNILQLNKQLNPYIELSC